MQSPQILDQTEKNRLFELITSWILEQFKCFVVKYYPTTHFINHKVLKKFKSVVSGKGVGPGGIPLLTLAPPMTEIINIFPRDGTFPPQPTIPAYRKGDKRA